MWDRGGRITRPRFDHGEPISRIDTRPMVFVVFFIVVIAMLWASQVREHALLINLPQIEPPPETHRIAGQSVHTVSVAADGVVSFDGVPVDESRLRQLLSAANGQTPRLGILFEPDGDVSYDAAVKTLLVIHETDFPSWAYCIDGLEKHAQFPKGGPAFPLLTSIYLDPNIDGAEELAPYDGFDSCAPSMLLPPIHPH